MGSYYLRKRHPPIMWTSLVVYKECPELIHNGIERKRVSLDHWARVVPRYCETTKTLESVWEYAGIRWFLHSLANSYIYVVSNTSYIGAHEMSLGYLRLNLVYCSGEIVNRRGSELMVDGWIKRLGLEPSPRQLRVQVLNKTLSQCFSPSELTNKWVSAEMLEDIPAMDLHLILRWGVEIILIVILIMPRKLGKDAAAWRVCTIRRAKKKLTF